MYREHLEQTTSVSDFPSRQVIEKAITEHERQMAWIDGRGSCADERRAAEQAEAGGRGNRASVRGWIDAAGGLLGQSPKRPGDLPKMPSL